MLRAASPPFCELEEARSPADLKHAVSKPVFNSVIDLGLRDVGVANQPRRLAAHLGRWTVPLVAAAFVLAAGACVLVSSTGGGLRSFVALAATFSTVGLALALGIARRSPVVVVKVTAEGRNQATWMMITPFVLLLASSVVLWGPLTVPIAVITVVAATLLWRSRGRVPEALRTLRSALAEGEPVLGDGIGLARGSRGGRDAVRVVAVTDRRLLVTGRAGVLLDLPYEQIGGFGIGWKARGRVGTLSLTAGSITHAIGSIAPANLLSIVEGLHARGVVADDPAVIEAAQRGWTRALRRTERTRRDRRRTRIAAILGGVLAGLIAAASAGGVDLAAVPAAVQQLTSDNLPVDGRSNLTGGAATLTYTPGDGLRELRTDQDWDEGPDDGARWELRSSFTKGFNVVSLSHYVFMPRLDDPAAVAEFVAGKDREHAQLAGTRVKHTQRIVDGREGYVWEYEGRRGYWEFAAWFPQPVHTVRVECIARKEAERFKRLCAEAMSSLRFRQ